MTITGAMTWALLIISAVEPSFGDLAMALPPAPKPTLSLAAVWPRATFLVVRLKDGAAAQD